MYTLCETSKTITMMIIIMMIIIVVMIAISTVNRILDTLRNR